MNQTNIIRQCILFLILTDAGGEGKTMLALLIRALLELAGEPVGFIDSDAGNLSGAIQINATGAAASLRVMNWQVAEDAVATLCLYFAWTAARVGDEALVTRPMAALGRHIEGTPNLAHLSAFIDCPLMRWCRPRALHADIDAALQRVTARLRRDEAERTFATA